MTVNLRINKNLPGVSVSELFNVTEMARQFALGNLDSAVRKNNFEHWLRKQNGFDGAVRIAIPLVANGQVMINEDEQGNTVILQSTGNLANLLAKCPELMDKKITLHLEAQIKIENETTIPG